MRGAACGAFFALALGIGRGANGPLRISGALFCLGAAGHTLGQNRLLLEALGWAGIPVWTFSAMGAGLLWGFVGDLFGEERRPPWRQYAPAAVLLLVAVAGLAAPERTARWIWAFHSLLTAALMAHAIAIVVSGWRNDLVEPRRRLRGPTVGAGVIYSLAIAFVQVAESFGYDGAHLSPLAAGVLLLMALAGAAVFLRAEPALLSVERPTAPAPEAVAPQDRPALARLRTAMDEEEVWRREALTIGELADIVGVPEHRLRRLINDGLGYRNFAAFLNERRIAAARTMLASPAHGRTPIASIAFEVGFGSIGPFNRAFRDMVGETPSAFRAKALAGSPIPEKPS